MNRPVIVLVVARDWVVAEHNIVPVLVKLFVIHDFSEARTETLVLQEFAVVISEAKTLRSVEIIKNLSGSLRAVPRDISENPDFILSFDYRVPAINQRIIVLCDGLERAVIKGENICMPEVKIGNIKCLSYFDLSFPISGNKLRVI